MQTTNPRAIVGVVLAASVLSACGGSGVTNGTGYIPPTVTANLNSNKLQVAVGTAYNANDGVTGINVVETFRQTNGLSAVLADNPSISGPFTVGLAGAYCNGTNVDSGTGAITSSPQVNVAATPTDTTLGAFTGAFSYGLAPVNSDQTGGAGYYPGNPSGTPSIGFTSSAYDLQSCAAGAKSNHYPWWPQPFGSASQDIFLLGPPAVPFFSNGTYPPSFAGYSPGFTIFDVAPVAGTYTLNVAVPTSNAGNHSFSATGTLTSTSVFTTGPAVSGVAENGGGFAGTVTVPAQATETVVFIRDITSGGFFSVEVSGTGAQSWTLPATLGPCAGNGCQSGSGATASLSSGDNYQIGAVSFDYSAVEAGPPGNTSQTPTITGSNGQADLAIGTYVTGTY